MVDGFWSSASSRGETPVDRNSPTLCSATLCLTMAARYHASETSSVFSRSPLEVSVLNLTASKHVSSDRFIHTENGDSGPLCRTRFSRKSYVTTANERTQNEEGQEVGGVVLVNDKLTETPFSCLVGWLVGCLDGWVDVCLAGWMDGWVGGWVDGWMLAWRMGGWLVWFVFLFLFILYLRGGGGGSSSSTSTLCKTVSAMI